MRVDALGMNWSENYATVVPPEPEGIRHGRTGFPILRSACDQVDVGEFGIRVFEPSGGRDLSAVK